MTEQGSELSLAASLSPIAIGNPVKRQGLRLADSQLLSGEKGGTDCRRTTEIPRGTKRGGRVPILLIYLQQNQRFFFYQNLRQQYLLKARSTITCTPIVSQQLIINQCFRNRKHTRSEWQRKTNQTQRFRSIDYRR